MDTLTGSVERITYYNPENGYTVLRLRPDTQLAHRVANKTSLKHRFCMARCGSAWLKAQPISKTPAKPLHKIQERSSLSKAINLHCAKNCPWIPLSKWALACVRNLGSLRFGVFICHLREEGDACGAG